jgi:hypothetical protein
MARFHVMARCGPGGTPAVQTWRCTPGVQRGCRLGSWPRRGMVTIKIRSHHHILVTRSGQLYGHHSMGSRMMKPSIPLPGLILGVANYVIWAGRRQWLMYLNARDAHYLEFISTYSWLCTPVRCMPMKYILMRCIPMKYMTMPMRCTSMGYALVRCTPVQSEDHLPSVWISSWMRPLS